MPMIKAINLETKGTPVVEIHKTLEHKNHDSEKHSCDTISLVELQLTPIPTRQVVEN